MDQQQQRLSGWGLAAIAVAALLLAYPLRYVLLPFVVAAAMGYVASPAVEWTRSSLGIPRAIAVLLVYVLILALLSMSGYWLALALAGELQSVSSRAPEILHQALREILGGEEAQVMGQTLNAREMTGQVLNSVGRVLGNPIEAAGLVTGGFVALMGVVLTLVLFFYFLLDGARLAQGMLRLMPPAHRPGIQALAAQVNPMLRRYLLGLLIVVIYTSAASWLGIALVLDLPQAGLLAVATGVLELIPVVGPLAAATVVGVAAIQQGTIWTVLGFAAFYTVLRLSIDQVVGPLVLGRAAVLHPVVVIFAFVVGGVLYGPLGVLVAVPFAAVVKIALTNYYGEG